MTAYAVRKSPVGSPVVGKCFGPAPEAEGVGVTSRVVRCGGRFGEGPRRLQSCVNVAKA